MYTLRFPFRLQAGHSVGEDEASTKIGDLTYSITTNIPYCVITVQGFGSEEEAKDHIHRVWAGLMWLLLNREVSPDAVLETQKVAYTVDPIEAAKNPSKSFGLPIHGPVDGLIDGSWPAVFPTDKHLCTITASDAKISITTPRSAVLASLIEGAAYRRSHQLIQDSKLRVALELYGAYFTESSSNARFLTLIMALEVLATSTSRPQFVLNLIDQWKTQVDGLLSEGGLSRENIVSLKALCQELLFRKEDSIRKRIYNLVLSTLRQAEDGEAQQLSERALKLYNSRSKLVHEGKLPDNELSSSLPEAKRLVQRVLKARYLSRVL